MDFYFDIQLNETKIIEKAQLIRIQMRYIQPDAMNSSNTQTR